MEANPSPETVILPDWGKSAGILADFFPVAAVRNSHMRISCAL